MESTKLSSQNAKLRQGVKFLALLLLIGGSGVGTGKLSRAQSTDSNATQVNNQATFTYAEPNSDSKVQLPTEMVPTTIVLTNNAAPSPGRITGCTGEVLDDYNGFRIALYEARSDDSTETELGQQIDLTPTEVPDTPGNDRPAGMNPNDDNENAFSLFNSNGSYVFLLDGARGQLDAGRVYLLLIQPPNSSAYDQRRIRIVLGNREGDRVSYTATALDGKPLNLPDSRSTDSGSFTVQTDPSTGKDLVILNLNANICQAQEIQIIKTGDRAAAEPGDILIYRLAIRNLSSSPLNGVRVTDNLPLGFGLLTNSLRAEFNGKSISVDSSRSGSDVTLNADVTLPPGRGQNSQTQPLTIVYAVATTPDAIRGSGQNSASVRARRTDNNLLVRDGPTTHRIRMRPGILSDTGTLIGRVFVDKNFDGEQQDGEPGVPNAVVYMDDGNRIVTDANGLFSVANVLPGARTAVLDLSSLPGYALAPNRFFIERNSQSRLVRLEPGGLARVNFAVTPAFQEVQP